MTVLVTCRTLRIDGIAGVEQVRLLCLKSANPLFVDLASRCPECLTHSLVAALAARFDIAHRVLRATWEIVIVATASRPPAAAIFLQS
jgi:hypothetical protein